MIAEENDGQLTPFRRDNLKFDFRMMNSYLTQDLIFVTETETHAAYEIKFPVPEKYGTFKLIIDHNEPGYSIVHHVEKVLIKPRDTDETPRFQKIAIPYYISTLTMIIGSFFIGLVALYYPEMKVNNKEKTQ